MNIKYIHIFPAFAALLLCAAAVSSCSQDEIDTTLPSGKYPLLLKASVDRLTSQAEEKTESEYWTKGDIIRVRINDYPALGSYTLDEDGSVMTSDEPLAWPSEEGTVRAWFPYFYLDETIETSIQDQSEGYHDFNFMTAVSEDENFKNTVNLVFKHKMAKVRCVLKKGEGITYDDFNSIRLTYSGYTSVTFSEDDFTYEGDGWITPYSYTDENSCSIFEALLAPKDMSGKDFIKVVLDVTVNNITNTKTLVYTPSELNLEAGSAYTFNITVQKDRLVVEPISGAWVNTPGEGAIAERIRVNLPANHGQILTDISPNATLKHDDEKNIDYLLVQGFEFSIAYMANDNNRMNGFVLDSDSYHKMTRTETNGEYIFEYKLDRNHTEDIDLAYSEYVQRGDFYYSDGTWGLYHPTPWNEENQTGVKIIGVVFRVGAVERDTDGKPVKDTDGNPVMIDTPDNYDVVTPKLDRILGYVVALNDAREVSGCWLNTANNPTNSKGRRRVFFEATGATTTDYLKAQYSGYLVSKTIRTLGPDPQNGFTTDPSQVYENTQDSVPTIGFLALKVADLYRPAGLPENVPSAPESSSGWYLPSSSQFHDIIITFYALRLYIEGAGGTYFKEGVDGEYWSSTQSNPNGGQVWAARYNRVDLGNIGSMGVNKYVRSVLTFFPITN